MGWVRRVVCCLVAGLTMFLVGTVFYFLTPIVAPAIPPQYENRALFRHWNGWTSTYMMVHPFGYGIIFAGIYQGLRAWCAFPAGLRGGLSFGAGVFLVGALPVYALVFAIFTVSPDVVVSWVLQSGCQYMAAGMSVGLVSNRGRV